MNQTDVNVRFANSILHIIYIYRNIINYKMGNQEICYSPFKIEIFFSHNRSKLRCI